tara:strand:- start:206 stop:436 length:231 start_codon:yes stop_codon:yes gene_type:complete
MIRYCIGCGDQIPPKRIEIIPSTKTCTGCSTTGAKIGVTVMHGNLEKDDTWVETEFINPDDYVPYPPSYNIENNEE